MSDCIFCKIIAGEIPSTTVYEDADVKAILDVNPAAKGHVIVLPKAHAENVFEISDEDLSKAICVAKRIAAALKKTYNCDGVNILQNNGEAAGQTVFHLHIHVIPRFVGDTVSIGWKPGEMPSDMAETAEAIRANLEV
ncbi:MAG: HIT family protein [Eubacterium sp.]|nr:HIT family protein [Eubacterium sp.]